MSIQVGDIVVVQDSWCPEIPTIHRVVHIVRAARHTHREQWYIVDGNRPGLYQEEILVVYHQGGMRFIDWPKEWDSYATQDIIQLIAAHL